MWIVLEPTMVSVVTPSKIVHLILNWASLPCPSKGVHKKHHLLTFLFWWKYSIAYIRMKHYVVDCPGTEHGFGRNSVQISSIYMGLGIIALRIKRCT
jgi:hypothetical protein